MIFYYSGCGNSKFVAEWLSKELNDRLVFMPEAAREGKFDFEISETESVGFVFPVYCWAPPELVTDFVKKMKLSLPPRYMYMVTTCGDDIGMTETIFRKSLGKKGWVLDAAASLQMPNTYINISGMNLDSQELAQEKIENAQKLLPSIASAISNRLPIHQLTIGGWPKLKSYVVKPLFYKILVNDKRFRVKDSCTGCGICVKNCPLKNIQLKDGKPQWMGGCTTCMSCYHRCPQNAIQFGKATEGKGQYFFHQK